MWFLRFITLLIIANVLEAHYNNLKQSGSKDILCGEKLNEVLNLVCNGIFAEPEVDKKSYYEQGDDYELARNEYGGLLPMKYRRGLKPRRHECCERGCSLKDLEKYCG